MAKTQARDAQARHKPKLLLRHSAHYTKAEKLAAVTIMLELGGLTIEAINTIRTRLNSNVSADSLNKWMKQYRDEVVAADSSLIPQPTNTSEIVRSTQQSLVNDLIEIQHLIVAHIKDDQDEVVGKASLRDSMVSLGISSDKLEAWLSISPGMRDRCNRLTTMCLHANLDAEIIFDDMLLGLQKAIESRQIGSGQDVND